MTVLRTTSLGGLAAAYRSDAGRVRGNNEDLAVCDPDAGVFGVIDGVGGQTAGEVAAAVADRVVRERLSRPLGSPSDRVREAIALANNEIWKLSEERPEYDGMTCVMTLAILNGGQRVTVGHVGDSRCYKMTAGGLRKLTHDHSPVGEREDAGELTEAQAMRHPRRNEVFRDVGSEYRDKDDGEFIEIVEETLESDAAILLCTDGLTDMIDSSAIERVVRTHAGDPQAVADALVGEANSAGGNDNVTVVYAEAPGFAAAVRGTERTTPTSPRREGNPIVRGLRWISRQYATWLAAGILIGVAGSLALIARLGGGLPIEGRHTLVVGEKAPFARIATALAAARPGDVVQVEPGTYAERLSVPEGVDLVARVPYSVVLRRLETVDAEWIALTANGPGTISGIRFESTAKAPIAVGLRISGADRRVTSCDLDGPMRAGIELADARSAAIESTTLHISGGPATAIVGGSDIRIAHSTFVRGGAAADTALSMKDTVRLALWRNVFSGYGSDLLRGATAAERAELFADAHNFVF